MRTTTAICALILSFGAIAACAADQDAGSDRADRLAWWRDARFGMFIHWGPVSIKGTEMSWSRANSNPNCPNHGPISVEVYDNLYKEFNPTRFDAEAWMEAAKSAGMKYIVFTTKHCDGFLNWNSKVDGYNIAATPFKRDICAELAAAAHRAGMKLGWYFSPMDWRDPDFRTERNAAFVKRMQGEVRELLTNYGKIDLVWFDFDGREAVYDQEATYRIVNELQPRAIINNRLDIGPGEDNTQIKSKFADYYTPERRIGRYDDQRPWETCMTLGTQWSWKPNDEIKSAAEVIGILTRCAGGDGNLLLDVGPMPDGRIEPRQVDVLKQVGAWLAKNGESIYGTRGGPYKPAEYGACTRKEKTIYLHVLNWPESGTVTLPPLRAKVISSRLLAGGAADVHQSDQSLEVSVAQARRDAADTVVALTFDSDVISTPSIVVPTD
jgi:alpha-L-fucosidase